MRKKSLSPWFEVDTNPTLVQRILPQNKLERFEGIDLSPSGDVLAIATSETNAVLLFRRRADGRFEDGPYQTIDGSEYPHDVSFSNWKNGELLAVAQRAGAIAIYSKNGSNGDYTSSPMFEISGPHSRLAFSDGVVFVPPHDRYLAACTLELGTITFFRITSLSPLEIQNQPEHPWKTDRRDLPAPRRIPRRQRLASIRSRLQSSKTPGSVIRTRSPSRRQLIT